MKNIKDGDLYASFSVCGREFSIYYGYYDDAERESPYGEPTPIYPDFIREPIYTADGYPYVTEMQDVCPHYEGSPRGESCYACRHFERGAELIGLCRCGAKRI